jgi:serine/threonine-protein kinase
MPKKEKFGKLVLLEETEATGVGPEYRAAKLGTSGLEKIVTIVRLKPAISGNEELARALMDQAKVAAQLQNPNVLKILGIGKVDQTYYISLEHVEGKSLRAILDRCRQESFPFSVEHALLIASKVASALEYAHGRRNDAGARYIHGLLAPACVLVSYEGEVRVKGFGQWPGRLREAGVLPDDDLRYLSPEQVTGGPGDPRSDVYALGAILFEILAGQGPDGADLATRVAEAKLVSSTGDDDSIPKPLAEILLKSLARDPGSRYGEMQEMRKAIDTLLFSGDFTPTTFNLAFFMHSLYREDIEREARALKEDKEASYLEYLPTDTSRSGAHAAPPAPSSKTEPVDPRLLAAVRAADAADAAAVPAPVHEPPPRPPHPPAAHPSHPPHESSPGLSAKEAAASFTFHKEEPKGKSKAPLFIGLGAVVVVAAAAGYFLLGRTAPAPPVPSTTVTTLSPAAVAALDRVRELEEKLAALEKEKAEAEGKAAEDAKKKIESQAAARGQQVDPAALARAQEEARRKAKEEQERRQQEELRRIAEQRKAEEDRLAEERRRAEEAAKAAEAARVEQARLEAARLAQAAAAQPVATPPPVVAAPTTTTPPPDASAPTAGVKVGTLVNLNDLGVTPPIVERASPPVYPPIALRQRVDGTVELNVFVDEKGTVLDVQVVQGAGGRAGLNEAAVDSVKKRRYRPATKDGVPVKVWMSVRVRFELPN